MNVKLICKCAHYFLNFIDIKKL